MFNKDKKKPKYGFCYAIHHGDYAGQMFIYIKKNGEHYMFLSIPVMKNMSVKREDFERGYDQGIVNFVKKIPSSLLKIIKKQFDQNAKNINN